LAQRHVASRHQQEAASRFARVRVRVSPIRGESPFAEETLLIEWPKGEAKPTKYWLATVAPDMPFHDLVDIAHMRWRIEHDHRGSSRKSASAITRAEAGRVSIITARCAS
jgi:hypothetical protein